MKFGALKRILVVFNVLCLLFWAGITNCHAQSSKLKLGIASPHLQRIAPMVAFEKGLNEKFGIEAGFTTFHKTVLQGYILSSDYAFGIQPRYYWGFAKDGETNGIFSGVILHWTQNRWYERKPRNLLETQTYWSSGITLGYQTPDLRKFSLQFQSALMYQLHGKSRVIVDGDVFSSRNLPTDLTYFLTLTLGYNLSKQ